MISFERALTMSWYSCSIILLACELYDKITIYFMTYQIINLMICFLFSGLPSHTSFWKHLYQQITFSYKNFTTCFVLREAKVWASDQSVKSFHVTIRYFLSWFMNMWMISIAIFFHKLTIYIKWSFFFFLILLHHWHSLQVFIYSLISLYISSHQYCWEILT